MNKKIAKASQADKPKKKRPLGAVQQRIVTALRKGAYIKCQTVFLCRRNESNTEAVFTVKRTSRLVHSKQSNAVRTQMVKANGLSKLKDASEAISDGHMLSLHRRGYLSATPPSLSLDILPQTVTLQIHPDRKTPTEAVTDAAHKKGAQA